MLMAFKAGPFTPDQVKRFAANGQLTPNDLISRDGDNWHFAERFKGLTFRHDRQTVPSAPAPLRLSCPTCRKALSAPQSLSGYVAKCPSCGARVNVPQLSESKPSSEDDSSDFSAESEKPLAVSPSVASDGAPDQSIVVTLWWSGHSEVIRVSPYRKFHLGTTAVYGSWFFWWYISYDGGRSRKEVGNIYRMSFRSIRYCTRCMAPHSLGLAGKDDTMTLFR